MAVQFVAFHITGNAVTQAFLETIDVQITHPPHKRTHTLAAEDLGAVIPTPRTQKSATTENTPHEHASSGVRLRGGKLMG